MHIVPKLTLNRKKRRCKSLLRPALKTVSVEESSSVSGIPWGVSVRKFTSGVKTQGFPPAYLSKIPILL